MNQSSQKAKFNLLQYNANASESAESYKSQASTTSAIFSKFLSSSKASYTKQSRSNTSPRLPCPDNQGVDVVPPHKPGYALTLDTNHTMTVLRYMKVSVQHPNARGGVNELTGEPAAEGPGVASLRRPWKPCCDPYEFCPLGV